MKKLSGMIALTILTLVGQSQAQSLSPLNLSLDRKALELTNSYKSINFSSRLSPDVCGQVLQQLTELGINKTQDSDLNQILNSIAVECGLSQFESSIQFAPVYYQFANSDLKILWDGKSVSVNEKAELTLKYTMPGSFNNVVQLTQSQLQPKEEIIDTTDTKTVESTNLGILDRLTLTTSTVMNKMKLLARDGQTHVIWSGIAYHDRGTYSAEKIKTLNEKAWGIGFESVKINENGNREAVAAMVVRDSHFDPQLSISYEWQTGLRISKNIKLWGGYTAGLISRSDFSYIPIPFALPSAGISIGKLNLKTVFIPSLTGVSNGNVLFIFASVPLNK